jgi:uncharacterized linocin/CFP29 family protein
MANNLGRDKLPWEARLWDRIDQAVNSEGERIRIARRFIPLVPMPDALTTPADAIAVDTTGLLKVDEGLTVPLIEIWVEFALTKDQVGAEERLATAVTLATRATNLLAQAEDALIFQGKAAIENSPIFQEKRVHHRAGPAGPGLLNNAPSIPDVEPSDGSDQRGSYGERTFTAVTRAYSDLQKAGQYGPYALVFHTDIYADSYAPLKKTLIMPADRIKPLMMDKGFLGTGTLPPLNGLLLSVGGNTIDLVIGRDAITGFMQEDSQGLYRFRVFERFAVRDKDATGRIKLGFKAGAANDPSTRRHA